MGRSPQPTREQTCPCPLGAGYSARPPAPRPGPSSHLVGGQRGAQKRGADSQARHSPQQGRAIRGCGSGTCLSYGLVLGGAGTGERAMVPGRGVANEGLGPGERVVREKRQEVQEVCGQSPSGPGWREWLRYRGGAGRGGEFTPQAWGGTGPEGGWCGKALPELLGERGLAATGRGATQIRTREGSGRGGRFGVRQGLQGPVLC